MDDDTRLFEIERLQRLTEALTAEVVRREAVEAQLVEALARETAARHDAEVAARAKGDFLAVMSHELRTPLNAIGGYVQLIQLGVHGALTDGQRDALARVQLSQRHLLTLINQVLDLARIEQGRMEYAVDTIPLSAVVVDLCSMVEPLLHAKRLTCDVGGMLAPGMAPAVMVRADRDKVQQILLNLLSNAIKFTDTGGAITIDAMVAGTPRAAHIRVRDTGIGLTPQAAAAIFAPFVRVAAKGEGSGLGLTISRSLARGMGGDLTVVSTAGSGSTFTLSLPLASSASPT